MTERELDQAYTDMCNALSAMGEAKAQQFLCRFALLAMHEIDNPVRLREILDAAGDIRGS